MNIFKKAIIATAIFSSPIAIAAEDPIKVGLMLPSTGTYAKLGNAITNGFKLYITENEGKLSNRPIEIIELDDASDPSKATDNMKKLINSDKVDVVVGTVHSGVAMAMAKVAKETGTMLIVPNAGAAAITGPMCAPNIYRSSFTMWQPGYAMGKAVAKDGHKKVVTITWKYGAGKESVNGFKESFEKAGGKVVKELEVPFPSVEFQALLTEIAATKPDAVFTFFAGGGAVKFVKDYAAAGLKDSIPLYGSGFLTDGTLKAQGGDGEGLVTTLHYADGLDTDTNISFRKGYTATFDGLEPDVYAVQGYDAAQILAIGLDAVKGDISKTNEMSVALEAATIVSPRGEFKLSKSHNPVQDIYLRKAVGNENLVIGMASKALADPARGCRRK
ncbi:ABC transporter substrate-binding protein [Cocleimonas sp. KMM 6892]|uniref:ABC transporter substrate-binding protein n=1 Tax=unclassified Cocleimonas TaxID=2639732 RepID=UPI002DBC17B9|nr:MULTISPECIES: ABC transporter substrate-binding protein [unclassified Cocleimonas]MEB8432611.1 ABC transporter substrate-binding protein [Cocleimonas sp. KMM 6892]MEC4715470.1 ABC transporter substrate-binding protein [Cocleimonas sp. KMM 6895]MEC4744912.1 ABC transporter substrate-binding protein [Cocleimonas sp. KMM 6896]